MKNKIYNALRWSERYTKTDMVYLVGQTGWVFVGQIIIFFTAIALAWSFANFIDPSDYGLYKFVVSIATIASITTLSGFGVSIARAISQGHEVVLFKLLKIQITYGLLGSLAMLIASGYYLYQQNTLLASLFAVTAIWIPFYESFSDYQYLLQGKKDFKMQTILRIGQRILLSLFMILAILLYKNIVLITFVYFMTLTITQFFVYKFTTHKYPMSDDSKTPYNKIIYYGKQLSLQNIFFVGAAHLDKILMFKFVGPAQLAVYFFATALPNELQGVISNINSVAFPKMVAGASATFKKSLLKKISLLTLLLTIPVFIYIIIAPYIFNSLFPVYTESIIISQLYVGTILFIPSSLLWLYFHATAYQRAIWFGTIIGPSVLIISILILVPIFGLMGAVFAVYMRGITDLITALIFFRKEIEPMY